MGFDHVWTYALIRPLHAHVDNIFDKAFVKTFIFDSVLKT